MTCLAVAAGDNSPGGEDEDVGAAGGAEHSQLTVVVVQKMSHIFHTQQPQAQTTVH